MDRWHDNWDAVSPIFKFSKDVRTAFYTTNAIESLNSCYRRLNKQRSVFPSFQALMNALYLGTFEIAKNGQCQSETGEKYVASWKSCTLSGCRYHNLRWNVKKKYTLRFFWVLLICPIILLLNRQRSNSRPRCQAVSNIIEALNLQKNFTPSLFLFHLLYIIIGICLF